MTDTADQPKRPRGRPPEPVPEDIARRILDGLHAGQSLTRICSAEGMPSPRTVSDWKAKDETFAAEFARARASGAEYLCDEAQDIADRATPENVQVAKLQGEMRWKRAACFCPSVFGAKAQVEHSGGVQIVLDTGVPKPP
jgi:hypothetical protein